MHTYTTQDADAISFILKDVALISNDDLHQYALCYLVSCATCCTHSATMLRTFVRSKRSNASSINEQGPLELCASLRGKDVVPRFPAHDSAPAPR